MKQGMHWADILAALYKSGSAPSLIAEEEGVSRSFVSGVVRGSKTSHEVAYAIAAKTNITTERMWPGKYLTPRNYQVARNGKTSGSLRRVANG